MIRRRICVAFCVLGLSLFSGCSRVDCEGRYQLDDGRCPCAPGVLPELQADGSVMCDEPMPDAQPADAGPVEDGSTGTDASRPCESEVRYADDDMDGYGDPEREMSACDAPTDWVADNTDCDDSCITCFPGAEELCDGENNDCADNELVDETFDCEFGSTRIACMTSCGSMGVGDCSATCSAPEGDTCIAPAETCNGADDDCDGLVDEGSYNFDDDSDGYSELEDDGVNDCNDNDPWTYPGATEDCDSRDNDCDGLVDEGEDDSEDGACAFLVERVDVVATAPNSCSSRTGRPAILLVLLPMLGLLRRRR